LAAIASWIEFFLEAFFLPSMKSYFVVTVFGVAVCIVGDVLRKLAMFHAGKSFSHIVQSAKKVIFVFL
jgi:protein-S-isoprenylcysteine O-methyltransferase